MTINSTGPTGVDSDLLQTMQKVLAEFAAPRHEAVEHRSTADGFDRSAWSTLDSLGLTRLTASEAAGGSGASWRESAALLGLAASHGVVIPIVEHDLLAGWLRERAGLEALDALSTACVLTSGNQISRVPWAAASAHVVVLSRHDGGWRVTDLPADEIEIVPRLNMAGEPRDTVRVDITRLDGPVVPAETHQQVFLRGSLARSVQMCAAMERALALSVRHVTHREQFGRALGKFQAVQHLVADAAAEVALAKAATEAALVEAIESDFSAVGMTLSIGAARSCAGHAASEVVRGTHQIHGAIGTTFEHSLRRFTVPVLAWRQDYGSVRFWDDVLTRAAVSSGGDGVWQLVADGGPVDLWALP